MLTRATTPKTVTISNRFNGPARSGNGGYACGLVARLIEGPAQVVLRRPPPLGVELHLVRSESGVALREGATTIATATRACIDLEIPRSLSFEEASHASVDFGGFNRHPFPTCFVCGPRRAQGDGLRIFPGRVRNEPLIAAPWIPDADLADCNGLVWPEFVWAALDCPTGWVTTLLPPDQTIVLGTLAVEHQRRVEVSRRYVLAAWPLGSEGRKFFAGAALWSDAGDLHAVARATWIHVSEEEWSE